LLKEKIFLKIKEKFEKMLNFDFVVELNIFKRNNPNLISFFNDVLVDYCSQFKIINKNLISLDESIINPIKYDSQNLISSGVIFMDQTVDHNNLDYILFLKENYEKLFFIEKPKYQNQLIYYQNHNIEWSEIIGDYHFYSCRDCATKRQFCDRFFITEQYLNFDKFIIEDCVYKRKISFECKNNLIHNYEIINNEKEYIDIFINEREFGLLDEIDDDICLEELDKRYSNYIDYKLYKNFVFGECELIDDPNEKKSFFEENV